MKSSLSFNAQKKKNRRSELKAFAFTEIEDDLFHEKI